MDFDTIAVLFILCFAGKISNSVLTNEFPVHDDEKLQYKSYLTTKTPYRFVENLNDTEIQYEGCVARRIWSVIRHGTRTPGIGLTGVILTRMLEIRDAIVQHYSDSGPFREWNPHPELDDQKRLTSVGEEEMEKFGKRLKNRFPAIFPDVWSNDTFLFRTTDTSRTRASLKHFTIGVLGEKEAERVQIPVPSKKDSILRFYKVCSRWRSEVKKNPKTLEQRDKFVNGDSFTAVVKNITRKFRLPDGTLDRSDIQIMYSVCAFETAWDTEKESPWCSVFSIDEFKILEYAKDLEYFAIDGYGHQLSTKIACPLFKNAIAHLRGDNYQSAVFYFTHSGTILKFLSYLGLSRDEVTLKHDNYLQQENRLWRTSKIDAFASNVVFVRFDCDNNKKYILTMHQERPIILPGCPANTDLCPLEVIEQHYTDSLSVCDLANMCSFDESYFSYITNKLWNAYDSLRQVYF